MAVVRGYACAGHRASTGWRPCAGGPLYVYPVDRVVPHRSLGIPELLRGWRYRKAALGLSAALSLSCLSIVTWTQVGYWQNSITLFEHTLKVTDRNEIPYNNRGNAYWNLGNYRQAIEDCTKAIELNRNMYRPILTGGMPM